ncbi:efflux transporter outer membrane subunit [Ideonella oryzae]|uniref:Efflux transporter outer membrane subunit n=1 Tax=Ideonella oryzae TaxID=2937441 RepID=A0ABT1BJA6_9BURK|nr:efflux transporter outer membrane subunit [Ideonella oryzae]MCO5976281.1 efflux transporter outer membrane subunit [Ideonella oryzae]
MAAPMPAAWQNAEPAATASPDDQALRQWWGQFDDPQLQTLIREALTRNPDLRSARATLAQAQASRAVIAAGGRPQLSTPASATRSRVDSSNTKLYKIGVSASWELDWNHAIEAGVQAADASMRSAADDLATARMVITSEVALAYFQWRGAQWRQRVAQANLASLEETRQLVDWKAQAGLLSQLDQDQARQSSEQTRAAWVAAHTEVAQDAHLLAQLTGRTPGQMGNELHEDSRWPATDGLIARLQVGVPADLLRRRPDLRSAEALVVARWYSMVQTRRDGEPTFALTGSLGLQATALKAITSGGAALVSALGLNIDWPIWEAGKREALVAEQKAAWELSRASYESTLLGAVQDVEDALVATRDSVDRCQALQTATEAAQRVVDTQRQRHEAGLIDTATLLDSQRTLLSLQTSLATARTDQAQALVRLYKSLGGGWSQDDIAVTPPAPSPSGNPLSALFRNEP